MITLGDAIVYFKGDSTGLDASVAQMTGRVQGAGDNMRRALNFGALVAGAQTLGSGINALIAEANDSERSFSNLEAAVTATGGAAGYTAQQLAEMAGELSGMTAIDDEAIQDGQAMLVTFKNIGQEVFPEATKAMLDMATAMNGGLQPSGEQLKGTAIQLGKALNDPIAGLSALSRVGVSFTETQKAEIQALVGGQEALKELAKDAEKAAAEKEKLQDKLSMLHTRYAEGKISATDYAQKTAEIAQKIQAADAVAEKYAAKQREVGDASLQSANLMKAQKIILAELSSEFGGQAAARLNTFQGRADALKISMGNLMAEIGKFAQPLTPILTLAPGAATVFNGLKTGVMAAAGAFGFMGSGATAAAAAFPAVSGAATTATAAVGTAGMAGAATAATAAIAGPGALVAAAGFAVIAIGAMGKAAWDAGKAKQELANIEKTYPEQVQKLIAVLDREGIAYDKGKMAAMSQAQQIDYLNQLYGKHVATVDTSAEKTMVAYEKIKQSADFAMLGLGQALQSGQISQEEYAAKTEQIAAQVTSAWAEHIRALEAAASEGNFMAEWIAAGAKQKQAEQQAMAASGVGQNAAGTDNWRGGLTWVGEQGPELVNLPSGTQIFDAETSRSMMGAAGGVNIQGPLISGVSVSGKYDVNQLAADMMDALKMRLNQRGVRAWA